MNFSLLISNENNTQSQPFDFRIIENSGIICVSIQVYRAQFITVGGGPDGPCVVIKIDGIYHSISFPAAKDYTVFAAMADRDSINVTLIKES
jgi:hypothetical protein